MNLQKNQNQITNVRNPNTMNVRILEKPKHKLPVEILNKSKM